MSDLMDQMGIQAFYDNLAARDLQRKFQFRVTELASPMTGTAFTPADLIFVETAKLPEYTIVNTEVPFQGGMQFNLPGPGKYEGSASYAITFRMNQDNKVRNKFENWLYTVFSNQTSTGQYGIPSRGERLTLSLFNNNGDIIREYTLYGIYCTTPGSVDFSIGETGFCTYTVNIAYQYWRLSGAQGASSAIAGAIGGALGGLAGAL